MEVEAEPSRREGCAVHADRLAIERCARCGRAACLPCAIPVRGEVLCIECATREVGTPAAAPAPTVSTRLDVWLLGFFGLGLAATVPPWDRFGALTSTLSAWRPDPDGWPLVACLAVLVGAALAAAGLRRPSLGLSGLVARASLGLAALGVLATAVAVVGAPEYVSHTPAPYVTLAGAAGALVASAIRLRRRRAA